MSLRTRLAVSLLAILVVLVIGTAGFMLIESEQAPTWLDAAYMTVITVSTVGFTEVWEHSPAGRVWTILLIILGISTVSVAFTSLVTLFISGEMRSVRESKKMETRISHLRNHVILCGYGRMGQLVVDELRRQGVPLVVLEHSADQEQALKEIGVAYMMADATDEDVLLRAGLMRSRSVVAALRHDADNVYITLTVHTLCPKLSIISRAEHPSTEFKLRRAGATRVVCPQVIGATRVVNMITKPNTVDFVEMASQGVDLEMDEYVIKSGSPFHGMTLREAPLREQCDALVVAMKRADGSTLYNPDPDAVLAIGDTIVMVGPAGISDRLDELAQSGSDQA